MTQEELHDARNEDNTNAGQVSGAAGVSGDPQGASLDEEARLRQQGQTPQAGQEKGEKTSVVVRRTGRPKGSKSRRPPKLLLDYRWVYEKSADKDVTQAQQELRKLFKKDPKGFLSQMAALEKAHLASRNRIRPEPSQPVVKQEPEEVDYGALRTREIIDRLLTEHGV